MMILSLSSIVLLSCGLPNSVVYPVRSVVSSLPTLSLTHPFMWKNSINHHFGDHRNIGEHSTQIFRSRIFHAFTVHYLPLVCLPFFLSLGLSPRDIPTVLMSSITALSARYTRCKFRLEEWRSLLARPYGRVICISDATAPIPEVFCKRGTPTFYFLVLLASFPYLKSGWSQKCDFRFRTRFYGNTYISVQSALT